MEEELLSDFKNLIDEKISELEKYASGENAKIYYIQQENKLIQELVAFYNHVSRLRYFEAWLKIEAEMQRLEKIDGQIHGHVIQVMIRQRGTKLSHITYNPFTL